MRADNMNRPATSLDASREIFKVCHIPDKYIMAASADFQVCSKAAGSCFYECHVTQAFRIASLTTTTSNFNKGKTRKGPVQNIQRI